MADVFVFAIDEVGDWNRPTFIIGGSVYALSSLWDLEKELKKVKEDNLKVPNGLEVEFKWCDVTGLLSGHNRKRSTAAQFGVSPNDAINFMKEVHDLLNRYVETTFFAVVELPCVGLWCSWRMERQKGSKKKKRIKMEESIRKWAFESLASRYSKWLKRNFAEEGIGLIVIDKFSTGDRKHDRKTVEDIYHAALRTFIYQGDRFHNAFSNLITPFMAHSHHHPFIELNDFLIGAFGYFVQRKYEGKQLEPYSFTKDLYILALQKLAHALYNSAEVWGYGLLDIPTRESKLRQRLPWSVLKSLASE